MDYGEARRWLMAYNIRQREQLKISATLAYNHLTLIDVAVARGLGEKISFPQIYELYPDLFEDVEKQRAEEEKQRKINEINKQRFLAFANNWNARFEDNDGRKTDS